MTQPPPAPRLPTHTPASPTRPELPGRVGPQEAVFRASVLVAAAYFLLQGVGAPWHHGTVSPGAGLLLAAVAIAALAFRWQTLGDHRQPAVRALLVAAGAVLAIPLTAILTPKLGASFLPDSLKSALADAARALSFLPGGDALLSLIRLGVTSVLFFALAILLLLAGRSSSTPPPAGVLGAETRLPHPPRGLLLLLAVFVSGAALFLYSRIETLFGLGFLLYFFHIQWGVPVLVREEVLQRLAPVEVRFLSVLQEEGALAPEEARLLLDDNAAAFQRLVNLGLVHVDPARGAILPGVRLASGAAGALGRAFDRAWEIARRLLWIALGIAYTLLPDLFPGPIDDLIVLFLCSATGLGGLLGMLLGRRRSPPGTTPGGGGATPLR